MRIGEWIRGEKPVHVGLYHISVNGHAYWSWWDGKVWRGLVDVLRTREATPTDHDRQLHKQDYNWRGIINEPPKPKPNFMSFKRTNKPGTRKR